MDRDRKVEVGRNPEHLVHALNLQVGVRAADVLEIEADLADRDDHLVTSQLVHGGRVRLARFQRVVPDARPHFLVRVSE